MPKGDVHVVYRSGEDKWAVEVEGKVRASSLHHTKTTAMQAGTRTAKRNGTELLVHGTDGKIQERNTYKRDPYPPTG